MIAGLTGLGLWFLLKTTLKKSQNKDPNNPVPDKSDSGDNIASKIVQKFGMSDKVKNQISKVQSEKTQNKLRSVSLHQVTMPLKNFVGRKGDMVEILQKNREGTKIFCFYGQLGIGKTSFGVYICEKLVPFYPHSQIYFDLEFSETPRKGTLDAMAHVLKTLRPEIKIPSSERDLATLYFNSLRNKKAVLFFDNISGLDQIKKLKAPKSCVTLFTSSKAIKDTEILSKELSTPPSEDARDILLSNCPRIGFWTAEIGKSCGYNPLALSICSRFLGMSEEQDPGAFSTQLRDANKKLERGDKDRHQLGIESTLSLVLSFLADHMIKTLAKLMVFKGSFDASAEGFICDDRSGDNLDILTHIGLVHYEKDNNRYRIHKLVREWMSQKQYKIYSAQAQMRHATYYMTTMEHIKQLYNSNKKDQMIQALQLFDLEWPNIREGQAWAKDNGLKDFDAAKVCNGYAEAGTKVLKLRCSPKERLEWYEAALSAARYQQNEESEKNHLLNIGTEYLILKDFKNCTEYLEKAVKLGEQKDDPEVLCEAYHKLGQAYIAQNQLEKGIELLQKELGIANKRGESKIEILACEELGNAYFKRNEFNEAIEYFNKGLTSAQNLKDTQIEIRLLMALSKALIKSDQGREAINFLKKGLAVSANIKNAFIEAELLAHLGDVHVSMNENPQAMAFYEKAVEIYKKHKDSNKEAEILGRQGLAWIKSGNPTNGIQLIEKAIKISRANRNIVEEMTLLSFLGAALLETGNIQMATEAFDRQLNLAKKTRSGLVEAKALHHLGQLEQKQGNIAKAVNNFKMALNLYERAKSPLVEEVRQDLDLIEKQSKKPVS